MELARNRKSRQKLEELSVDDVLHILKATDLNEFEDLVRDKGLDGQKLFNVTEGIVKLWRTKSNANRFIKFVEDLKQNPDKYVKGENGKIKVIEMNRTKDKTIINVKHNETVTVENKGKRVSVTTIREENITTTSSNAVEDILNKIVPPKSFLYRNKTGKIEKNSYLPMNIGHTPKRPKSRFFRLSSYEYPIFDLSRFKYFSSANRNEIFNDRGYYSIKNQQNKNQSIEDLYRTPETRGRRRSQGSLDEIVEVKNDKLYLEEHFYEDLCYSDVTNETTKRNRSNSSDSNLNPLTRSYIVRIQEMFHSFRMPSFFKNHDRETLNSKCDGHVYENNENSSDMYDSVHVNNVVEENDRSGKSQVSTVKLEEYLEPIHTSKDYCDVIDKEKEDSLVGILMKIFDTKFGSRRESQTANQSESENVQTAGTISATVQRESAVGRANMAARPLPVPVESEAYYMAVDRMEAVRLLEGQEDGMFLLRPSSQPTHAYTLSVCCGGVVHNIGVRRREDGRLALGYARRGERCFDTLPALLQYHRRKKLLLVAGGTNLGSTTLKESPMYYQVPMDEQSTTNIVAIDAGVSFQNSGYNDILVQNGSRLHRIDTVPDIKRDTSGITTQYVATGIVNLGAFAAGACVSWSSSALPLLTQATELTTTQQNGFHNALNGTHHRVVLTEHEASWTASLLCLGALCGAVPAGLISEYFGRKKTLLYLALPLLVSWVLIASSPNVYGLYVGRFVGGVAVGAFSVAVPPYVADIAEPHLVASLANFYHVQFSGGILFGYIIGMVQSASWLSVLCASIPVTFFIAFLFLPESPAYLVSQGKSNEAKTALRYFRGIDNDIDEEIKVLKEYIRNYARNKVTFNQLFKTRSTAKALIVSFGLMIFQQMSGIYPVVFYAEKMFKTFAISMNPPGAAIILGFCLVSSTYFSTMLLRMIRRRILLMLSFSFMAVNAGALAIYYNMRAPNLAANGTWLPVLALCLFVTVYAAGVGPIPWLMLREIFPSNVTRRATAITVGFHWFLAFLVTKLYQNMVEMVRPGWVFWHFAVTCLFGALFVYFLVPETKGRTLAEIQNEFSGIHKKKKHMHVIEVESVSEI